MILIPTIIDTSKNGYEYNCDIYSKLLKERIIFISGEINDQKANLIIAQLLYLEYKDSNKDIHLYINSPGGMVNSGISIYDTMNYIKNDINTICIGQAYSIAAFLLTVGTKGKRFSLPNSSIMIHQPWGGYKGQTSDIAIYTIEMLKQKKIVNNLLSLHTGKDIDTIEKDTDRNFFLSPLEAIEYGLIDSIKSKRTFL